MADSNYFYPGKRLVHFSSVHALLSILGECGVRLYNLHNLNDPREFTFASKIFNLGEKEIKDAKDNLHIMSFAEETILKEGKMPDEFNMWRLYGQQGRGICIVFEVVNDPMDWYDFHLGKVQYGAPSKGKFHELVKILKDVQSEQFNLAMDVGKLYAFHKSNLFRPELEVRLISDRRENRTGFHNNTIKDDHGNIIFPLISNDLTKLMDKRDDIKYLQLPIYSHGRHNYKSTIPLLKIKEIQLGYFFGNESAGMIEEIKRLCKKKIGYIPIVKRTRLHKFYWGST